MNTIRQATEEKQSAKQREAAFKKTWRERILFAKQTPSIQYDGSKRKR